MEWIVLIEMIIEMIMESRENQKRKAVVRRLRDPGFREAARLRIALGRRGYRGEERKKIMARAFADLKAASDKEIDDLVKEADTPD